MEIYNYRTEIETKIGKITTYYAQNKTHTTTLAFHIIYEPDGKQLITTYLRHNCNFYTLPNSIAGKIVDVFTELFETTEEEIYKELNLYHEKRTKIDVLTNTILKNML